MVAGRAESEVISSFLRDWRVHGDHALAKVRRTQPAVYCKLAVLRVARGQKVEHTNAISGLSDEQLEAMIADIQDRLDRRATGDQAKVIEGTAKPTAIETTARAAELEPAPRKRPNRLLEHVDTAVGPRERKPRKRRSGAR